MHGCLRHWLQLLDCQLLDCAVTFARLDNALGLATEHKFLQDWLHTPVDGREITTLASSWNVRRDPVPKTFQAEDTAAVRV